MATGETNSPEFQEKTGLKRKPTGPPRLLLGKSKSPGQDEKKSDARKQRRQNATDTPTTDQNKSACEVHEIISESSRRGLESEKEIHIDVQEVSLGTDTNSEHKNIKKHDDKKVQKRSRSKAAFQRLFYPALICVRKKKGFESTSVVQDDTRVPSGDSLSVTKVCKADQKKKAERRIFSVRTWSIFKRCSTTSKFNQRQEKTGVDQVSHGFIEIVPETRDRFEKPPEVSERCSPETSELEAEDGRQNGSGVINEDMATIHDEDSTRRALDRQDEGSGGLPNVDDLNTGVSGPMIIPDCDGSKPHLPPEEPMIDLIPSLEPSYLSDSILPCIYESGSDAEEPVGAPGYALLTPEKTVPTKPVITIEDVHSSDEETPEPVEDVAPPCSTVSGLLSLSECYKSKTKTDQTLRASDRNDQINQLSEILLARTAFNLVRSAISGALEQLAADLQSQTDVDHV